MLSIFQLVSLSDVFTGLILLATTSPPFLMSRRVSLYTGGFALALKQVLWQGIWSRPSSGATGGLSRGLRRWWGNWGRRHWWRWRRRCCKAPEVKSSIISSPASSPQSWEGALCSLCLLFGDSWRLWSCYTRRTAAAICNWLNHRWLLDSHQHLCLDCDW